MSLKTVILSLRPRLRVPVSSSCVHRDTSVLALLYYEHSSGVFLSKLKSKSCPFVIVSELISKTQKQKFCHHFTSAHCYYTEKVRSEHCAKYLLLCYTEERNHTGLKQHKG